MAGFQPHCIKNTSGLSVLSSSLSNRRCHLAGVVRAALLSVSLSALCIASAYAADRSWTGIISTDASNPGNWSAGTLPGAGDNAIFDTTAPNAAILSGGNPLPVNFLIVGNNGAGNLTVQNGGAFSPANNFFLGVSGGSSGVVTVTGTGTQINGGNALAVGYGGDGVLLISSGGQVSSAGETRLGVLAGSMGTGRIEGAGSKLTIGGDLVAGDSGTGSLTVASSGSVSAAGKTYLGKASGSTGTGTITGSGSMLTSTGDFATGFSGSGSLTITNGGTVQAGSGFFLAVNNGSSGTLNIGAASGDAAQAPGTLNTAMVTFGEGTGTLNFNHTSSNYMFAPGFSLKGTVNQIAGTTILTGDGSNFTGSANVTGGNLIVNSNFKNTKVTVTGGTLGGTGTVGVVVVNSGGTLAPGNSIGTLSAQDFNFFAGSTYDVEINSAGQSDQINATGFGNITGGTVRVTPLAGADPNTTYTILTAGGGLGGTFDDVISTSVFVTPSLSYDLTHTYLNVSISNFCLSGFTFNQCQSAGGAQSLGAGNSIYDAVFALGTYQEAQAAFDALSGEVHSSVVSGLVEDSRFAREAAMDRLRSAFAQMDTIRAALESRTDGAGVVMSYADSGETGMVATDANGPALWTQAFGAYGFLSSDGNAAQFNRGAGGIFVGGDAPVADMFRLGLFGGYTHAGFNVGGSRASSGTADGVHLGAYGGGEWDDFSLRVGGAASWHRIAVSRSPAFTGFTDMVSSAYNASTLQGFGEAAYRLDAGEVTLEPFASLAYIHQQADGASETGGPAALSVSNRSMDAVVTTLGLRAETEVDLGEIAANASGMVGWQHAFGGAPTSTMTYLSGGSPFTIAGVPLAQDALTFDAALDFEISPNAELGLSYSGQFSTGGIDQSIKAGLHGTF